MDHSHKLCASDKRRGLVLVWTAVVLSVLILVIGLALDTAKVKLVANQLQNASDAAALAGGRLVRVDPNNARIEAMFIAQSNYAERQSVLLDFNADNIADGDIVIGRYNPGTGIFEPRQDVVNAIKVVARRTDDSLNQAVGLHFGPMVNVNTANVSRSAIAMTVGGMGAGLIILAEEGPSLMTNGNLTINVSAGDTPGAIQINSRTNNALDLNGSPILICAEMNIVAPNPSYPTSVGENNIINTAMPPIPDPLAHLTAPYFDSSDIVTEETISPGNNEELTLTPGYYPGGFDIKNGKVNLEPGIYILGGGEKGKAGLVANGGEITGQGVMFYIDQGAKVDIGGNGIVSITELDFTEYNYPAHYSTEYQGMVIFQDRMNTTVATLAIGSGEDGLSGTMYFPNNTTYLSGTGAGNGIQLITHRLLASGTGTNPTLTLSYDGRNQTPVSKAFLVK